MLKLVDFWSIRTNHTNFLLVKHITDKSFHFDKSLFKKKLCWCHLQPLGFHLFSDIGECKIKYILCLLSAQVDRRWECTREDNCSLSIRNIPNIIKSTVAIPTWDQQQSFTCQHAGGNRKHVLQSQVKFFISTISLIFSVLGIINHQINHLKPAFLCDQIFMEKFKLTNDGEILLV